MPLPDWLVDFSRQAELTGLPFALSFICLIHYLLVMYYRYFARNGEDLMRANMQELRGEMTALQRERFLTRLENQILREIVNGSANGKAIDTLLKKFVPNSNEGLALFIHKEFGQLSVFQQRGLSGRTASRIRLDDAWIARLGLESEIRLTGAELNNSTFLASLSPQERRKLEVLHLFALTDEEGEPDSAGEFFAVIATSRLFPPGVEPKVQRTLVARVLEGISGSLQQSLHLVDQQYQLKLTQEKLALRGIADRAHDTPGKLLDDYISRLSSMVEADRGTLLLATQNPRHPFRVLSRQGQPLQTGLEQTWHQHERQLGNWAKQLKAPASLSATELAELGIDCLMGSALVLPLTEEHRTIGLLCLTRRDQGLFSATNINLADWAADFLTSTLLRLLDRMEVERQASLDGLTDLANRRTFDMRIQRELDIARRNGQECSLALCDLDHFKNINDTYGHMAGDEILRQFARLMERECSQVRATDAPLVARYGGEEMAVLFPNMGVTGALRVAESIRAATERAAIVYEGERIPITVSIGVSTFPRHAQSVTDLIQSADRGLYQAKRDGRNLVRCFINEPPGKSLSPETSEVQTVPTPAEILLIQDLPG